MFISYLLQAIVLQVEEMSYTNKKSIYEVQLPFL